MLLLLPLNFLFLKEKVAKKSKTPEAFPLWEGGPRAVDEV